jgi:uncharacterized protein (TIGR03084 family)
VLDAIVAAVTDQQAELAGLLSGRDELDWQRPSACQGWTVADVVLHLAQTNDLAVASAVGRYEEAVEQMASGLGPAGSVDEGADRMVARDRGQPGRVVGARWQTSADALIEALKQCDPHQRLTWVAGELSARTLATTRLAETWIHTGDVAAAFGAVPEPTDRLWHIARLAWRTLPYAFGRAGRELAGPVAFELRAPSGERWDFGDRDRDRDREGDGEGDDTEPLSTIRGESVELCLVAARRAHPDDTALRGEGPDAEAVLELVRTYA